MSYWKCGEIVCNLTVCSLVLKPTLALTNVLGCSTQWQRIYYLNGSPTVSCLLDVKKGFPSVKFANLFKICLIDKKLPAVVCRVLAFMYEEQVGFIRIRGRRSANFRLINGLREGAACSPVLWAVYADGLLLELRKSGLGCYIAGKWVGAVLYADDLSLIAPTRATLSRMLALVHPSP